MLRVGQGKEDRTFRGGWHSFQPQVEEKQPLSTGSEAWGGGHDRLGSPSSALLAQALVCVDVGFAAGARVCHILEVIDEAGDQTAAQITPHEAAEETQHEVHQANLIGDLRGDGLLAVGTHSLHWCSFKDLSLQHCHCGGSP